MTIKECLRQESSGYTFVLIPDEVYDLYVRIGRPAAPSGRPSARR